MADGTDDESHSRDYSTKGIIGMFLFVIGVLITLLFQLSSSFIFAPLFAILRNIIIAATVLFLAFVLFDM